MRRTGGRIRNYVKNWREKMEIGEELEGEDGNRRRTGGRRWK